MAELRAHTTSAISAIQASDLFFDCRCGIAQYNRTIPQGVQSGCTPEELMLHSVAMFLSPNIHIPGDFNTNFLMITRWIHFLFGITWIGLLYFFNLVNVPFQKELDATTKGKVVPILMPRALWWFRMAAVITVLAGIIYFGNIVATDAHNAGASSGLAMGSFFGIWTVVWGILYVLLIPGKGALDKGPVIAVIYAVVVLVAAW